MNRYQHFPFTIYYNSIIDRRYLPWWKVAYAIAYMHDQPTLIYFCRRLRIVSHFSDLLADRIISEIEFPIGPSSLHVMVPNIWSS